MNAPSGCADLAKFSPRERQIIAALTAAQQVGEIARKLHLTTNTVKAYIKSIYFKAEVHSARELMLKFPPMARGADERLDSFRRVLAARDIAQLHTAVLAMLRTWTEASRVLCWEVRGDAAGKTVVSPHGMKPVEYGPATECADAPRLMRASEVSRDSFLRAASAARPLEGEVCLLQFRLLDRRWLLALADPATGAFAPDALGLARMLVRLAEHHAELFRPRAAAAAAAG